MNCKSCRCPHSPILRYPISSPPSSNFSKSKPLLSVSLRLVPSPGDSYQTGSQKPQNRSRSCMHHNTTRRVSLFNRQFVRPCFSFLAVPVHDIDAYVQRQGPDVSETSLSTASSHGSLMNHPPTWIPPKCSGSSSDLVYSCTVLYL